MDKIFKELIAGNQALLETEKLTDFWEYCKTRKELYTFRYEYYDAMVKITLTNKTEQ